ncbi:hypothetical protein [Actinomycetospora soli]|uniref:hypothetical protein n=1 Tax=Actinomycetospora soli TaxID=2893887 RepID=UPI001E3CE53A|nr:hypothetical protein [Actinomycetospora soli]MCD2190979.1 hypothetical protein [Actinomycetospora soli]
MDDPLPWEDSEEQEPDISTAEGLLGLLDAQAALLVDVATGGSPINSVNESYRGRRRKLDQALRARGMSAPFPFEDLWSWRGYWQAQGLTTYQSRRNRVADLARPAREGLESALAGVELADPGASGASTWAALDTRLAGIVRELGSASDRDDLQDVGRRCREVLIDAARLLATPDLVADGTEAPKAGDAKSWLDLFLAQHAAGRTHRELRAFVPAAWDLAQKVTHGGVDRVDAYAAAQATVLVIRVLQQLAP